MTDRVFAAHGGARREWSSYRYGIKKARMGGTIESFDIAVLGGGPGGYSAALRAALRGASVCLIEKDRLGGASLNTGCIPTKAMLHASRVFWDLGRSAQFGLKSDLETSWDGPVFMGRVAAITVILRNGLASLLDKKNIRVITGRGRLVSAHEVIVRTEESMMMVRAGAVILASGSRPVRPSFVPWDCTRIMTTDEAASAEKLPPSAIILGGGAVGCELATIYGELGIPVELIEQAERLAPSMDIEASAAIRESLARRGVNIRTGTPAVKVLPCDEGVMLVLADGRNYQAHSMICAVGRQGNIEDIGLSSLGVRTHDGLVCIDERCRTNLSGLYAVGDVAEGRRHAHLATRMGIVAADNATGHDVRDNRTIVPWSIFTHPEVAAVGLSHRQAVTVCPNLRTGIFSYKSADTQDSYAISEGKVKLLARAFDGKLLGATVIGENASEIIQEIASAMRHSTTMDHIVQLIHARPVRRRHDEQTVHGWLGLPANALG